MKKAHAYKTEDKLWEDFQTICNTLTQQGKGRITPAYLVEQYVIKFVEENKKLLEGRK